jgi:ribosomal protein L30E
VLTSSIDTLVFEESIAKFRTKKAKVVIIVSSNIKKIFQNEIKLAVKKKICHNSLKNLTRISDDSTTSF